ncbi:nitroreductase family protein [Streptomyces cellulosae]|uniref:Nitroreductase family protein n=1 Tax=Streptomyces cellulosae TaxID=1968 RepID=A0ABW6JG39_STRCE
MAEGETCQVQTAPGALLHPWEERGRALSLDEARCLMDALEPVDWRKLAAEYDRELLAGLMERGALVRAPARPRLWTRYGWARAEAFVAALVRARARHAFLGTPKLAPVAGVLEEPGAVAQSLRRRSVRSFAPLPLPHKVLESVLAAAEPMLKWWPHLRVYVAAQHVVGVRRGVYAYAGGELLLRRAGLNGRELVAATNQHWVSGTGVSVFVAVVWKELERMHGRGPDAYMSALVDCGRLGEVLMLAAGRAGAGCCAASSLDGEASAQLCGLPEGEQEALYMLRVGVPPG